MGGRAGHGRRAAIAAIAVGLAAAALGTGRAEAGDAALERRFDAALAAGDVPGAEEATHDLCAAGAEGELFVASRLPGLWDRVTPRVVHILAREAKDPDTFFAIVGAAAAAEGPRAALFEECPQAMAQRLRDDPLWSGKIAARVALLPEKEAALAYRCAGSAGGETARALLERALDSYRPEALRVLLVQMPAGSLGDRRTLEALAWQGRDARTDLDVRMAIVEALARTGRAALPALVGIHAAAVDEAVRDPRAAGLARVARAALVKLSGGIDHGETGEAWRLALERGGGAGGADGAPASAPAVPVAPLDLRLVAAAAALGLGGLAFALSRRPGGRGEGWAIAAAPVAFVCAVVALAGRAPERRVVADGEEGPALARPLTSEAREELARRIWDYLRSLREGPVASMAGISWAADEEVRSGRAFAPLAARFDTADDIAIVDVSRDTARVHLHLADGRVARGRLVYDFRERAAELVWFRYENTLPMSATEWRASTLAPAPAAEPGAAAPSIASGEGGAATAVRIALAALSLALVVLALRALMARPRRPAEKARPAVVTPSRRLGVLPARPSLFRPELRRHTRST